MLTGTKIIMYVLIICFTFSSVSVRADKIPGRSTVIGVDLGVNIPIGSWKDHRILTNTDQFGNGMGVQLSLEKRLWNWGGLELGGGYLHLATGQWEDASRDLGDNLNSSAYLMFFDLLFKVYPLNRKPNIIKTKFGFTVVETDGRESFAGMSYKIDYLKTQAGFVTGAEYVRFLNETVALSLNFAFILAPAGIKYADGEDRTIITLPVFLGIRFHL